MGILHTASTTGQLMAAAAAAASISIQHFALLDALTRFWHFGGALALALAGPTFALSLHALTDTHWLGKSTGDEVRRR